MIAWLGGGALAAVAVAVAIYFRGKARERGLLLDAATLRIAAQAQQLVAAEDRERHLEEALRAWNSSTALAQRCVEALLRRHPELGDEWLELVLETAAAPAPEAVPDPATAAPTARIRR